MLVVLATLGALAAHQSGAAVAWWWLTVTEGPVLSASLPQGPIRGSIEAHPELRAGGPAGLTSIMLGERTLGVPPPGAALAIDTATLQDGTHTLELTAQDFSLRRNRTTLRLTFTTDNTPPTLTLSFLAAERLRAGQVTAARVGMSEPAEVGAEWGGAPLPLLSVNDPLGARIALLGAPVTSTAGSVRLSVTGQDKAGNHASHHEDVTVESATLPRQNLLVPAALAQLATGPVALDEAARLHALTSTARAERLWTGEFRAPVTGPRTTGFGDRRDYADGHLAFHAGYDVAVPERTPILSPAAGVVSHTGTFPQRGSTVVIDHGWGVFTVFGHLAEIRVSIGQAVAVGQTLGLVGSTGLSTGPHLHWEVRLRGQPVDPDSWFAVSRTLP